MSSNGRHFGEIRLSALKKAPEMFGSVYEHEEKKPMEAFVGWLTGLTTC